MAPSITQASAAGLGRTGGPPVVAVVGDLALDVVVRHDTPIAVGGDTPSRVHTAPGGSAAATARGLARSGTHPVLITRVGDDAPGRDLVAGLRADGVRCSTVVDPTAPTGCVVVLVDASGERTMLPDRGANARLRPKDVALPGDAVHLHLSGYVLLDPRSRPAGLAALTSARARGVSTSVDPASAPLLRAAGSAFVDWVAGVDLLLPNADEYAVLGAHAREAVGAVAVTEGAAGARWLAADAEYHVRAPAIGPVRDSTGAGDAFDAGLLAAWVRGASPLVSLRAGVDAAADILRQKIQ